MRWRLEILLLCMVLICGCQGDDTPMGGGLYEALSIDEATRSDGGVWCEGDQIGVAIVGGDLDSGLGNSCYSALAGGSAVSFGSLDPLCYLPEESGEVVGYYPYDPAVERMDQISIDVSDGECDLLVGRATQPLGGGGVNLPFSKLLSTIELKLHSSDEYGLLSQVRVSIDGLATRAIYDIVSDSFALDAPGAVEFSRSSSGDATLYISALPQNLSSDVAMSFDLGSGTPLKSNDLKTSELEGGEIYSYDIFLSDDGVIIRSLMIHDWDEGGSESGEAESVPAGYIPISTADELSAFLTDDTAYPVNGRYILISDLAVDLNDAMMTWGQKSSFLGIFDGNGHTINRSGLDVGRAALFTSNSGVIKNLTVAGDIGDVDSSQIFYDADVAGIVLSNEAAGRIINCCNEGDISDYNEGREIRLGGIAAVNKGAIYNCYNRGTIRCYNYSLSGSDTFYAGGIVGWNMGTVENVYSVGMKASGFAGDVWVGSIVGAILGENSQMDNIFVSEDDNNKISGLGEIPDSNVVVRVPEQLFESSEFAKVMTNVAYGMMLSVEEICGWRGVNGVSPTLDFDNTPKYNDTIGLGTKDFPYIISTASDIYKLAKEVAEGADKEGVYYTITNSISLVNGAESWQPIGTASVPFQGNISGAAYLSYTPELRIYINSYNTQYNGLFGVVGSSATISNLTVTGSVMANYYVGGVAAKNSGLINGCESRVVISTSGAYSIVGGIVGYNSGEVDHSVNSSSIKITGSFVTVGSIVGYNSSDAFSVSWCASMKDPVIEGYKTIYNEDDDYAIGYQE